MKKYNRTIVLSILLYVVLAGVSGYIIKNTSTMQGRQYRVEINQVMKQLEHQPMVENLDMTQYEYIKEVAFLKADTIDKKSIEFFYAMENKQESKIQPLY